MKSKKMRWLICFFLTGFFNLLYSQNFDLQFRLDQNDQTVGGIYDVTVQMKSSGGDIAPGSSNLVFTYNPAALETSNDANPPMLQTIFRFSGGNYNTLTLTEPVTGRLSLNIDLGGINNGTTISNSFVDVATIRFIIKNPAESANLSWRTTFPNGMVLFDDDQTTLPPAGNLAGQMSIQQSFDVGWNLIGLPVTVEDNNYLALYPNANPNTLFSYNSGYKLETTLMPGEGYWINFTSVETTTVDGLGIGQLIIDLQTGWNLISSPSCDVAVANIDDPGSVIVPGTIFGYAGGYFLATTLEAGKGYWINASAAGPITLNCTTTTNPLAKMSPDQADFKTALSDFPALTITDAADGKQTLYFDATFEDDYARDHYRLPPRAPAGAFDARFSGDYLVSTSEEDVVFVQSNHYPLEISLENSDPEISRLYKLTTLKGNVEIQKYSLSQSRIIITDPGITKLALSKSGSPVIPKKFAVEQNYPNPFNPTTKIRYALPEPAKVKIVIYNSLGQKVRTLVSGEQTAGYYTAVWDATNDAGNRVSSGLYLLRIKAGEHQAFKKMMLMR